MMQVHFGIRGWDDVTVVGVGIGGTVALVCSGPSVTELQRHGTVCTDLVLASRC
jgi:hypothetical protein